jgi:hypothetical protein
MPKNAFKMSADHHQIDIHARVAWSGDKQLCKTRRRVPAENAVEITTFASVVGSAAP